MNYWACQLPAGTPIPRKRLLPLLAKTVARVYRMLSKQYGYPKRISLSSLRTISRTAVSAYGALEPTKDNKRYAAVFTALTHHGVLRERYRKRPKDGTFRL